MKDNDMLIIGALAVGAYILYRRGSLAPRAAATFSSYPGQGTSAAIPGLGYFRSGPGGTQVAIDPNFISRLFPGASPGQAMQPGLPYTPPDAPVDQPWAALPQVTGGAYDAYRMGERDPAYALDVPLNAMESPDQLLPIAPEGGLAPDWSTFDPCAGDPACGGVDYEWFTG